MYQSAKEVLYGIQVHIQEALSTAWRAGSQRSL